MWIIHTLQFTKHLLYSASRQKSLIKFLFSVVSNNLLGFWQILVLGLINSDVSGRESFAVDGVVTLETNEENFVGRHYFWWNLNMQGKQI